jgi:hypothetical protein
MSEPNERDREIFKEATLASLTPDPNWTGDRAIDDVRNGAAVIATYREEIEAKKTVPMAMLVPLTNGNIWTREDIIEYVSTFGYEVAE